MKLPMLVILIIASTAFQLLQRKVSHLGSRLLSNHEVPSSDSDVLQGEVKKARRQRYSGRYPKSFSEKYKEIRGDNDTISKVISKGSTPGSLESFKSCIHAHPFVVFLLLAYTSIP